MVMRMEEGLDTGPVCLAERDANRRGRDRGRAARAARSSRRRSDGAGAASGWKTARSPARRSPATGATYAAKIDKAETRIDWSRPAAELHNQIRGLSPFPGAWCEFPRASGIRAREDPAVAARRRAPGRPGRYFSARPSRRRLRRRGSCADGAATGGQETGCRGRISARRTARGGRGRSLSRRKPRPRAGRTARSEPDRSDRTLWNSRGRRSPPG